jgi:multiple sugar transport system permease protein
MGIFLMRMSLQTFPRELEDSARMDGAGLFRIMFQIVFPIQKPILAYLAITTGIAIWNDWYTPFVFTSVERHQTLASAISRLTSSAVGQHSTPNWPYIITLGLGLTIPCLVLFAFFQRYIVEGLASAAVKG